MEHEEDLKRLEQFVEKLLGSYNELKKESNELRADLLRQEKENGELRQQIEALQDNKSVVRERVSGLISRIEEWEKSQSSTPVQA